MNILKRIRTALDAAAAVDLRFSPASVTVEHKADRNDPVTAAAAG